MCWAPTGSTGSGWFDRYICQSSSPEEMDRGTHFKYHPVNGALLSDLLYDEESCAYIDPKKGLLPRIGDGKPRKLGDPYLDHWQYDPDLGWHASDF